MTQHTINIISREELNKLFEEEERTRHEFIDWCKEVEIGGLLYTIYRDGRTGKKFAVQTIRTVHMGFNDNDEGKVEEFVAIVEREGACHASWGVTGRTMHYFLGCKLADALPQYDWNIGANYECTARKK